MSCFDLYWEFDEIETLKYKKEGKWNLYENECMKNLQTKINCSNKNKYSFL